MDQPFNKALAISNRLSDLDLISLYIPTSHYAMVQAGKNTGIFLFAPKRFWSTFYNASCFAAVYPYEGELSDYVSKSKLGLEDFIALEESNDAYVRDKLDVGFGATDRFVIYNNRLRMLRAWVNDRSIPHTSRNRGVHAVIFPGFEDQMLAELFRYMHCTLCVQPVSPLINQDMRPTAPLPYSHFEAKVNYQRLLEMVASARFCVGLPGPFTYLSIHLNIPTVVVTYDGTVPEKLAAYWGHVNCVSCPQKQWNHELLRAIDEASFFHEYLVS